MPILSKGTDFGATEQVTSTKLDTLVDGADFTDTSGNAVNSASTTGTCVSGGGLEVTSGGQLQVKDADIAAVKLASNSVITAKILDANVTKAKIENLADYKVLGNVSGGSAAPAEVAILDEDTLSSDSATSLATQQSIKAYVDGLRNTSISSLATAHEITVSSEAVFVDLSTLTTAITTKEEDSTFVISGMINIGYVSSSSNYLFKIQYKVGSGSYQDFNLPTGASNRITGHFSSIQSQSNTDQLEAIAFTVPFVDPAYSVGDVLTFKIQGTDVTGTDNIFLNRSESDTDNVDHRRAISTLKVEEL